jgi:hypothetical protein
LPDTRFTFNSEMRRNELTLCAISRHMQSSK